MTTCEPNSTEPRPELRQFKPEDLPWVAELTRSPGAAPWTPEPGDWGVLQPPLAFLHFREIAFGEFEILNLVVATGARRQRIARMLLEHAVAKGGDWFLEVRESNEAARKLYVSAGFIEIGRRPRYYANPREDAIVMRLKKC
jgi:GNAT superfamily N-acetyltransferase